MLRRFTKLARLDVCFVSRLAGARGGAVAPAYPAHPKRRVTPCTAGAQPRLRDSGLRRTHGAASKPPAGPELGSAELRAPHAAASRGLLLPLATRHVTLCPSGVGDVRGVGRAKGRPRVRQSERRPDVRGRGEIRQVASSAALFARTHQRIAKACPNNVFGLSTECRECARQAPACCILRTTATRATHAFHTPNGGTQHGTDRGALVTAGSYCVASSHVRLVTSMVAPQGRPGHRPDRCRDTLVTGTRRGNPLDRRAPRSFAELRHRQEM
jgi:hypothetical protein